METATMESKLEQAAASLEEAADRLDLYWEEIKRLTARVAELEIQLIEKEDK